VNLTDGLDGLASGLSAIAALTFAIFAYVIGNVKTAGYLLVFYMRDTGSHALGGALGAIAILLKSEFLLLFVGAVFLMETLSVILQRTVFKYRRRRHGVDYAKAHRVFLRAPLHHHFEMKGWRETQVVVRVWILGILSAFVALSTLKIR
jgi:phospho-N-acetylmuramoyl-pentapeptide-transferase